MLISSITGQGVSWSSIEYSGRWKVLNYGMASIYAPVTINPFWYASNETLEVLVTSDQLEPVSGTATLTWYNWGGQELASSSHKFTTPALNNSQIYKQSGLASILPHGINATDAWLLLNVTAILPGGQHVTNEQYVSIFSTAKPSIDHDQTGCHLVHTDLTCLGRSCGPGNSRYPW
jgi:beta-mannosidase